VKRRSVSSSVIRSIGYDEKSSALEIEFIHGAIYRYLNVPRHAYDGLLKAASHGEFFNERIKDAGYRYARVKN
jgi:hypothetical protein